MRIWYLGPQFLDPPRYLASHHENHIFLSMRKKGKRWGHWMDLHGNHLNYTKIVHDRFVLERGIRTEEIPPLEGDLAQYLYQYREYINQHNSPYIIDDMPESTWTEPWAPTTADIQNDIKDLLQKWENELYYYGSGRVSLLFSGNPPPPGKYFKTDEEILRWKEATREMVRRNSVWFENYRSTAPKSRMQDRISSFLREKNVTSHDLLSGIPNDLRRL